MEVRPNRSDGWRLGLKTLALFLHLFPTPIGGCDDHLNRGTQDIKAQSKGLLPLEDDWRLGSRADDHEWTIGGSKWHVLPHDVNQVEGRKRGKEAWRGILASKFETRTGIWARSCCLDLISRPQPWWQLVLSTMEPGIMETNEPVALIPCYNVTRRGKEKRREREKIVNGSSLGGVSQVYVHVTSMVTGW